VDIASLGAAHQPTTIYPKSLSCIFTPVEHMILANLPCACHDKVISLISPHTALFTGVQVTLFTHIGVNQIIMPDVACCGTYGKVILTIVADILTCCTTFDKVDVIIMVDMTAGSSICDRVDLLM